MQQMVMATSRRTFPRPASRRRGMGGILSILGGGSLSEAPAAVTGQPWYIPDFFYNLENKAAPDQVYAANQVANVGIVQAETNPITGQIVPAAQAYANQTAQAPGAAESQAFTQPTGSTIADTFNSLFSAFTGAAAQNPNATFPWGTLLVLGVVGVGGYLIIKKL